MRIELHDDLGEALTIASAPRRVVSLVPSLTEAVASADVSLLVGATDYCTHPASLDVARVGGSKYPNVDSIIALAPDMVLANVEENRRDDIEILRAAGVPVWVTYPQNLDGALTSLARMFAALSIVPPDWLAQAERAWAAPATLVARRALVPVWRRPWVVLGSGTFAGDLLRRLGVAHLYAGSAEANAAEAGTAEAGTAEAGTAEAGTAEAGASARYPRPSLAQLRAAMPDLLVLPDEPYAFTADDGPDAFPGVPYALVSGRHLTWYGPSLADARTVLTEQLAAAIQA